MTLILNFVKLHSNAKLPKKAHPTDGAFDLAAVEIIVESPNKVLVKTGLACNIPCSTRLRLTPRSSFTKYNWILNNADAVIDEAYTGEWMFRFTAIPTGIQKPNLDLPSFAADLVPLKLTYDDFPYRVGDNFIQMYEQKVQDVTCGWTETLKDTERGAGGFGSSDAANKQGEPAKC